MSNLCTRCGSERIFFRTWKEVIEVYERKTTVTNTEFVCPDPKCQKRVEELITEQRAKRKYAEDQKELEKRLKIKLRAKNIALSKKKS